LVALSGFVVAAIGTAPGGDRQVGNWHVNCQHSSRPYWSYWWLGHTGICVLPVYRLYTIDTCYIGSLSRGSTTRATHNWSVDCVCPLGHILRSKNYAQRSHQWTLSQRYAKIQYCLKPILPKYCFAQWLPIPVLVQFWLTARGSLSPFFSVLGGSRSARCVL